MKATLIAAAGVLGLAAPAPAQYQQNPYQQYPPLNPATVMPNVYNPQYQPLSPYLNLNRGGNPAVNYYYGVRPGTVGGGARGGGTPFLAPGGNRAAFFPQLATGPDPLAPAELAAVNGTVLPPAGHPVVFGNTMGYFPGSLGGGMRPGLSGIGAGRR